CSGIVVPKNSTTLSFTNVNPVTRLSHSLLAYSLTVSQFFHKATPIAIKAAIAAIATHTGAEIPANAPPKALAATFNKPHSHFNLLNVSMIPITTVINLLKANNIGPTTTTIPASVKIASFVLLSKLDHQLK